MSDTRRSPEIDALKVAGIVTVVLIHTMRAPWDPAVAPLEVWIGHATRFGVPAFLFASGFLYATAWQLMLQHPLGIGVGGFERFAPLDLRYPHNLFLEVGCELGWIPLLSLLATLALSLSALVKVLKNEYSWPMLFLGILVITTLLNSMVSGDLNDNRNFFAALLLPFVALRLQKREREVALVSGGTGPVRREPGWRLR